MKQRVNKGSGGREGEKGGWEGRRKVGSGRKGETGRKTESSAGRTSESMRQLHHLPTPCCNLAVSTYPVPLHT